MAAVPALHHGLAKKIEILPCEAQLIGTEAQLTNSLKTINVKSELHELDRGQDFQVYNPHRLTCFGHALEIIKYTLEARGVTEVVFTGRQGTSVIVHSDRLIAGTRRVTARLAENEGKLEVHFFIYRSLDSLTDYVQVAIPLPGLEVNPHPSLLKTFFLTAV